MGTTCRAASDPVLNKYTKKDIFETGDKIELRPMSHSTEELVVILVCVKMIP